MFVLSGARPDADRDPEPGAHRVAAQSHGIQFGESCNLFHRGTIFILRILPRFVTNTI